MTKLGYINYEQYNYNIKITAEYIYVAKLQVMTSITFNTDTVNKRKITNITEETEIIQNNPNKRIRNDGSEYESKIVKEFNQSGLKPIRTKAPDRGIDVIGEYNGITIYAQAKDLSGKVGAQIVQQLEGVLTNKAQSIGVIISEGGFTSEAIKYVKGSTTKIILTNLKGLIDEVISVINQIKLANLPKIEIIGESAEIETISQNNIKRTIIRKAKKVTITNF